VLEREREREREREGGDYLIAVVDAEQQDARMAAASPATTVVLRIRH
jgi:hypothetical protein